MTRPAIYQHLNDLLNKGLVTYYIEDGKKYFRITERGRDVLQAIDKVKILL